ncbi:MAG: hypothetical protein LBL58_19175 [Tannerellaceae bacterium]|jgi:hypothetical protein|nr:hypothetical protein [Tannerellaceae bacterium]
MRTVIPQERQTLLDLAIEYCGDVEAVFEIMQLNDLSITEELLAGKEIIVPEPYARKITEFYQSNNIQPATAYIQTISGTTVGVITNDGKDNLMTNDNNDLIVENDV